jgi:hypothetical protein|tara:strand:+ start:50 stop:250 length:201 start_codon:yes stop_codon:yes gene_type:complete
MKKSEIEIIKDVLIEAQEKIEKHLNIDSQSSDYVENVEQDPRFAAFYEIESGLYNIIQALKAQHIA